MDVFQEAEGFPDDLHYSLSEFNIGGGSALGIDQGAAWVDAFSKAVDHGIDSMEHWGVSYKWLSNKFYDTQFPAGESDGGSIVAIATPMGQIYDIAQSHLIGKSTMDQQDALQSIGIDDGLTATGFADDTQRIVFLHNPSKDTAGTVDLSGLPQDQHLSVRILTPRIRPTARGSTNRHASCTKRMASPTRAAT